MQEYKKEKKIITTITLAILFPLAILVQFTFAEPITVGVILPLTGKLARYGQMEQRAFTMAADQINTTGGVNGNSIELVIEDSKGSPAVGRASIERLISKHKACIISGGISSSVTWSALKVAQKHKVPFLVTTASADKITEKGGDTIFRLAPPASDHETALFSFLRNVARAGSVGVIYEDTLFGQSRLRDFSAHCKRIGWYIVAKEAFPPGTVRFEPLLNDIKSKTPDIFCMICSSLGDQASLIVRQAREIELNAKAYVGDGAVFSQPEFRADAGAAAKYVLTPVLWTSSVGYPGATDFERQWFLKYQESVDYHAAQAYAAMQVIVDALKRVDTVTPENLRDALAETDMVSIFGPVRFSSYGKKKLQNAPPTFLGQWINAKLEAVWPENLTTVSYIYPMPAWRTYIGPTGDGRFEDSSMPPGER